MLSVLKRWLVHKWQALVHRDLMNAYQATFTSYHGQLVLQHLLDNIYCTVYEGTDSQASLVHNARRSVVHEILLNLDYAEYPEKYTPRQAVEAYDGIGRNDSPSNS